MKVKDNSGVALYLVIVFTAIAVSLLMIMYTNLTATTISYIKSSLQDELYLESGAEMIRAGKTPSEVVLALSDLGFDDISVTKVTDTETEDETESVESSEDETESTEDETESSEDETENYLGTYKIQKNDLILYFSLLDGEYSNYYFTYEVDYE